MTRKEFKNHEWKVGDILYEVAYRKFDYFSIPSKVIRIVVDSVSGDWIFVSACNKRDNNLVSTFGYHVSKSSRPGCSNLFFTKDEAEKCFEKKCSEFKELHALRLHQYLRQELRGLDMQRQAIYGVMRMNIMQL